MCGCACCCTVPSACIFGTFQFDCVNLPLNLTHTHTVAKRIMYLLIPSLFLSLYSSRQSLSWYRKCYRNTIMGSVLERGGLDLIWTITWALMASMSLPVSPRKLDLCMEVALLIVALGWTRWENLWWQEIWEPLPHQGKTVISINYTVELIQSSNFM